MVLLDVMVEACSSLEAMVQKVLQKQMVLGLGLVMVLVLDHPFCS